MGWFAFDKRKKELRRQIAKDRRKSEKDMKDLGKDLLLLGTVVVNPLVGLTAAALLPDKKRKKRRK